MNSEASFDTKEGKDKGYDKLSWASQYGGGNRNFLSEFLDLSNLTDEQKSSIKTLVQCLEDANRK